MMNDANTQSTGRPIAAFIFSLLGGLWMLGAGLGRAGGMHMSDGGWGNRGGAWRGGWMHQNGLLCGSIPFDAWWPWVGLLTGAIIVTAAIVLLASPDRRAGWAIAIIVAAVVGLLFGTGGLIASILAIVGGILALTWSPTQSQTTAANSSAP